MTDKKKNRIIELFASLVLLLSFTTINSQQQPLYSQYMENSFLYNPALAGADGYTIFNLTAREQWIGFKQSPKTHTFSAQTRILKQGYRLNNIWGTLTGTNIGKKKFRSKTKGRVGLGAYVYDDRSGLLSRTGIQLTYAYHIYVRNTQISMGLGLTGFQFGLNEKNIVPIHNDDPMFHNEDIHMFVPDANVGIYVMNSNFYMGLSAAQLMESAIKIGQYKLNDYELNRHYYLNLGSKLHLNTDMILEPSMLLKTTENWNFQTDVSLTGEYQSKYLLGLSYRSNFYNPYENPNFEEIDHLKSGDIIALLGIQIKTLFVGYAFDFPLTGMRKYSYGSHELAISYKIGSSDRKYRWKDRF